MVSKVKGGTDFRTTSETTYIPPHIAAASKPKITPRPVVVNLESLVRRLYAIDLLLFVIHVILLPTRTCTNSTDGT